MADPSIDAPPKKLEAKEEIYEEQEWKEYFRTGNVTKLLHRKFILFSIVIGLSYITHFIMAAGATDAYSDRTRLDQCTGMNAADSSAVFDLSLMMLSIYHMVEWLRNTVLLTVVCIGVNIMVVWYITIFNTLFGLIAYIIAIIALFGEGGAACKDVQSNRYSFILIDVIIFFVGFVFFSFPIVILRCLSKQSHEKLLHKQDDSEDDE